MALSIIKTSGTLPTDVEEDHKTTSIDDGSDLLRECAGGCGKKILFFGFPEIGSNWGAEVEGTLCLECSSSHLKHAQTNVDKG